MLSNLSIPTHLARGEQIMAPNYADGVILEMREGGSLVFLSLFNGPRPDEIAAYQAGGMQFAVKVYKSVVFLLVKVGHMPWVACGFSINLYSDPDAHFDATWRPDGKVDRLLLTCVLVDSSTGTIVNLRGITLPPAVTRALWEAIREQRDKSATFSSACHHGEIAEALKVYRSERRMAQAAIAKGWGGA